jgi:hypothetical protein
MSMRDLLSQLSALEEASKIRFAGEPKQKPGDQVRGTDRAVGKKGQHPFQNRLVGGESLLRDLESALQELPGRDLMREYRDFIKEAPIAAPADQTPQKQNNKPTLGTDLTKPGTPQQQQQQQQDPAQQAAQEKLAQQEKIEQNNLQKGVASLKAAGAAVSNPAQVVKAFDKVDDQQALTPGDKGAVATAGTVLAPIMSNPQLAGKFKDLVTQASAAEKKQQQIQQAAVPAGAVGAPVPGQK